MDKDLHTETNTVISAIAGDKVARGVLYSTYSKAMFNLCIRMTGDRALAEDLLQEAFIIAFKNLKQLKSESNFGGWLKRIVINECIKQCKRTFLWKELNEQELNKAESDPSWYEELEFEKIHEEIKNLPSGCRQIFTLYVLEDYPHKKIAELLEISESTSKSQYQRARALLKERLIKNYMQYHG